MAKQKTGGQTTSGGKPTELADVDEPKSCDNGLVLDTDTQLTVGCVSAGQQPSLHRVDDSVVTPARNVGDGGPQARDLLCRGLVLLAFRVAKLPTFSLAKCVQLAVLGHNRRVIVPTRCFGHGLAALDFHLLWCRLLWVAVKCA